MKPQDAFWIELLDLCQKYGVTELRPRQGHTGRVVLAFDEKTGAGEVVVSDLEVRTTKPERFVLSGTVLRYFYVRDVRIHVVPKWGLRGIVDHVRGMLREWTSI